LAVAAVPPAELAFAILNRETDWLSSTSIGKSSPRELGPQHFQKDG
jgi:hypothetical protein